MAASHSTQKEIMEKIIPNEDQNHPCSPFHALSPGTAHFYPHLTHSHLHTTHFEPFVAVSYLVGVLVSVLGPRGWVTTQPVDITPLSFKSSTHYNLMLSLHLNSVQRSELCFYVRSACFINISLLLTPSLPWCNLKTTNKSAKFETVMPFCFLSHTRI